jgi:spore germination protein KB
MINTKKIGWGQALLILLCCRSFGLMTFVPLLSADYSVSVQMTAVVLSAAVGAVVCIPLLCLYRRFPGESVTALAYRQNSFAGFIFILAFLAFFIFEMLDSLLSFQIFLGDRFFKTANPYLWLGIFLMICIYCAVSGIEGIARSSLAVFAILVFMIITMAITSIRDFDPVNIYFDTPTRTLPGAVIDELAKNGEIVALAFLCKYIPKHLNRTVFGLLLSKIAVTLAVLLLIQGVLGDFAMMTDYPFLAVGAYSGVNLLQRADAAYLVVWTMTAVLKTALYLNICAGLLEELFPKLRGKTAIAAAVVYLLGIPYLQNGLTVRTVYGSLPFAAAQIVLIFAVPLLCLIFCRKGKTDEKLSNAFAAPDFSPDNLADNL